MIVQYIPGALGRRSYSWPPYTYTILALFTLSLYIGSEPLHQVHIFGGLAELISFVHHFSSVLSSIMIWFFTWTSASGQTTSKVQKSCKGLLIGSSQLQELSFTLRAIFMTRHRGLMPMGCHFAVPFVFFFFFEWSLSIAGTSD